jgi:NAD(P)H-quinone oxidoreductase subunit 5
MTLTDVLERPADYALPTLGATVVLAPALLVVVLGVASLIGRPLSERGSARAVYAATLIAFIATAGVFIGMLTQDNRHIVIGFGDWVHFGLENTPGHYHFSVKFVFDRLSVPFVALSLVLCGTIGAFANRYMHRELGYNRFFVLYSVFVLGMVIAALAGTIETLFAGWELVGLSSALLVGFFHDRPAPVRNALRVWIVYRVSDAALLLAAIVLHHMSGEGDLDKLTGYREITGIAPDDLPSWPHGTLGVKQGEAFLVGLLLLLAAAGKSALVPFSGWLPRAMEGPTPSSAVFYGALSVHLGAFLLLRISPLLDDSPALSIAVLCLGLLTAAYAALVGRVQTDIKSALSFASLTQVGLIVAEIGAGFRYVALVHLLGHACMRTLQFVRAPTLLQDRRILENALGDRLPQASESLDRYSPNRLRAWLYRFALERGYLDAILNDYVAAPFVKLFRWLNKTELALTAWMTAPNAKEISADQASEPKPEEQLV